VGFITGLHSFGGRSRLRLRSFYPWSKQTATVASFPRAARDEGYFLLVMLDFGCYDSLCRPRGICPFMRGLKGYLNG
jgi:hypothetical protein